MTTKLQYRKGRILYCIACGGKLTKREARLAKEEKLERSSRYTKCKSCMGNWEGYRCDDCITIHRLEFHRKPPKRGGYNK